MLLLCSGVHGEILVPLSFLWDPHDGPRLHADRHTSVRADEAHLKRPAQRPDPIDTGHRRQRHHKPPLRLTLLERMLLLWPGVATVQHSLTVLVVGRLRRFGLRSRFPRRLRFGHGSDRPFAESSHRFVGGIHAFLIRWVA